MLRLLALILAISLLVPILSEVIINSINDAEDKEKNAEPKSISISSVKDKGVILEKEYKFDLGYTLVIQTKNDIVETVVDEHIYKSVIISDTIK